MTPDPTIAADFVRHGLSSWWAPALAFAAGVVSFASPCVFPLVPGYLAFVSGGQEEGDRSIAPILLFIAGFATVFTLLGAFTRVFTRFFRSPEPISVFGLNTHVTGTQLMGGVIVAFGVLMLLYAFRLGRPGLYAEHRPFLERVKPGPAWAFPLGVAFGAGWTPCIGPVLAGVLLVAASQGGSIRGAFLLFMYSMGLGVPFFLVGVGVRRLMTGLDAVKRHYRLIAGVGGAIMVAIGIAVATNTWVRLLAPFLRWIRGFQTPL